LFVPAASKADAPWTIARGSDGSCVFFDARGGRLCTIHAAAGAEALPTACRHFPRQVLRDGRGTFISLSHFCPTAAAMLLEADPLDVVDAPAPLRLEEPVEGLDATRALPPLVRPGVLSDLEGYAAWERACIATFARGDLGVVQALDLVADATERVRAWQPGSRPLAAQVTMAFREARSHGGADPLAHDRAMTTLRALCGGSVRPDLAPIDAFDAHWTRLVAAAFEPFDLAMRNFLAARTFGNWIAYQGRGLRTVVEWLRASVAAVRHHALRNALARERAPAAADLLEAVRLADLLLLHVVDTQAFARHVMALEGPDPR
jgi:hypothetical protein